MVLSNNICALALHSLGASHCTRQKKTFDPNLYAYSGIKLYPDITLCHEWSTVPNRAPDVQVKLAGGFLGVYP